jgi:pimeloyl-ACP methyl ester carboxylesterase
MTGLCDALGERQAVIVGHDWGSIVAWNAALVRPDRFRAVVGISVPFFPRGPMPPTQLFKMMAGDNFMYILYFQEPGKAERELEADPKRTMRMLLYSASGSLPDVALRQVPKTAGFLDAMFEPPKLPLWLSESDVDFYAGEFARAGFRGGLNWYRNFDRNWGAAGAHSPTPVTVPAHFIGGLRDNRDSGPRNGWAGRKSARLCTDRAHPDRRRSHRWQETGATEPRAARVSEGCPARSARPRERRSPQRARLDSFMAASANRLLGRAPRNRSHGRSGTDGARLGAANTLRDVASQAPLELQRFRAHRRTRAGQAPAAGRAPARDARPRSPARGPAPYLERAGAA